MSNRQLTFAIPIVLTLAAAVWGQEAVPPGQLPCVQGYPGPISAGAQQCVGGFGHAGECGCEECSGASWWTRSTLGMRRHWFRFWQKRKHLQHPEAPPFFEQNWGYHPTCWRPFPPICNPCPISGPARYAPVENQPRPKSALPFAPAPPKPAMPLKVEPPRPEAQSRKDETYRQADVWRLTGSND